MANTSTVTEIDVYRDGGKWHADVLWSDGKIWRAWQMNYRSRKAAAHAAYVAAESAGIGALIVDRRTGKTLHRTYWRA